MQVSRFIFWGFFLMKYMMSTSSLKVKLLQIDVEIGDCCKKKIKRQYFHELIFFSSILEYMNYENLTD